MGLEPQLLTVMGLGLAWPSALAFQTHVQDFPRPCPTHTVQTCCGPWPCAVASPSTVPRSQWSPVHNDHGARDPTIAVHRKLKITRGPEEQGPRMGQVGPAAPRVWALTGHQAHLLVSFQFYFLKDSKYSPVTELPQNKTKATQATHPGSGQTWGAPGDSGDPGGPGPPPPQPTQPGSVPTSPTPAPCPPTGVSWLCSCTPVSVGHSHDSLSLPVSVLTAGIPDLITHHQTHFAPNLKFIGKPTFFSKAHTRTIVLALT